MRFFAGIAKPILLAKATSKKLNTTCPRTITVHSHMIQKRSPRVTFHQEQTHS
ncbi:unnamed protein product [Dovyalis caffra]|uniref:Uncharacterized protein n=1 Tax=Dovyalis caffra TaxID=77055 RepID=A0AAV1R9M2_9ROSI|nr:unnamed protein product [Dovyalis caffra]